MACLVARTTATVPEPTYCFCQRVSFGHMIRCDDDECPIAWFHYQCVGLTEGIGPKGRTWLCPTCRQKKEERLCLKKSELAKKSERNPWRDINDADLRKARWLLFLRHASKCQAAVGECPITPNCHAAKQLWEHALTCSRTSCNYPRCIATRELLEHHASCKDAGCPVCSPVRNVMRKQRQRTLDGQKGIRHVKRRTRTGPFRHQRKNKFPKRAAVS